MISDEKNEKNAILAYSYDTRRLDLNKFSQMFTLRRKVVPSTTHVGFYQHLKYNIDLLLALFLVSLTRPLNYYDRQTMLIFFSKV